VERVAFRLLREPQRGERATMTFFALNLAGLRTCRYA